MEQIATCRECNQPIYQGEMTHIQHNPRRTYHWLCYREFVDRVVKKAIENRSKPRRVA